MEFNYKPKFYDCVLNGIRTEGSKHLFDFTEKKTEGRNPIQIEVDQPSSLILERMKEIVAGKRCNLYLTRGMRDIDVSYLGNNKWQLFDEFDVYEFEYDIQKMIVEEEEIVEER